MGEEVRLFDGHTNHVTGVAFSPDGRYVLTEGVDKSARLWDTDYRDFITFACTRLFRDFTSDELIDYRLAQKPTCPRNRSAAQQPRPSLGANVDSIEYDRDADLIIVNLLYQERATINRIRIQILDSNNLQVRLIEPQEIDDQVIFQGSVNALIEGSQYTIRVTALDDAGAILNVSLQE